MHGLINKAIQSFVTDTYGTSRWVEVTHLAGLEYTEFESMLHYDDIITQNVLDAVSRHFKVPRETVLEDVGTFLVSNPKVDGLRRLLRFGGVDFIEFLHSLDDLPDRVRLAVSDLYLPQLELHEHGPDHYSITCRSPHDGFGYVLMGVLRALADDYGALVFLEHAGSAPGEETIRITLIENAFAKGRHFDLGARVV